MEYLNCQLKALSKVIVCLFPSEEPQQVWLLYSNPICTSSFSGASLQTATVMCFFSESHTHMHPHTHTHAHWHWRHCQQPPLRFSWQFFLQNKINICEFWKSLLVICRCIHWTVRITSQTKISSNLASRDPTLSHFYISKDHGNAAGVCSWILGSDSGSSHCFSDHRQTLTFPMGRM